MRSAYVVLPSLAVLLFAAPNARRPIRDLPLAAHNDNRVPAGTFRDGVLEIDLEVVRARWEPMGSESGSYDLPAFAEKGHAPSIPGPLIRVPAGTRIRARITNTLDKPLVVNGLYERTGGELEWIEVAPGETAAREFVADAEGSYFYEGLLPGNDIDSTGTVSSMLTGAFIVDAPGTTGPPKDRVLLIGVHIDRFTEAGDPDRTRELVVVNGRPWPHTERLEYALGDSIHWRVINASDVPHPMHLHGFYFRVDARGDIAKDTIYWPRERRMVVTESLQPFETMTVAWSPDRPGNWVFHCHLNIHVATNPVIGPNAPSTPERMRALSMGEDDHGDPHHHTEHGMGGLMMAIRVPPPDGWQPEEQARRELRLFIQSDTIPGQHRRYAYVLQEGPEPAQDSVRLPGSTIVLRRGEPTRITVINRSPRATSVHWHGMELESFFDGVAGVGGYDGRPTPAIMPGDSFHVYMTPPRAGSFMYHTHIHDIHQQTRGLYGPLLVLEPDEAWDPSRDIVAMIGSGPGREQPFLLNGTNEPAPIDWIPGQEYRIRVMNITIAGPGLRVRLVLTNGAVLPWSMVAKDGWTLPQPVELRTTPISIGETADFVFRPRPPVFEGALEVTNNAERVLIRVPIRTAR